MTAMWPKKLDLQQLWLLQLMLKCQIKTVVVFIFMKSNFPENFSQFDLVGPVIPGRHTVYLEVTQAQHKV